MVDLCDQSSRGDSSSARGRHRIGPHKPALCASRDGARRVDGVQPLTCGTGTFSARVLERDSEGLAAGWVRPLPARLEAL